MVFETQPNDPFHLDLPLVPDHKSTDIDMTFLVQAEHAVLIALAPVANMNDYDGPLFEIGTSKEASLNEDLCPDRPC